MRDAIRRCQLDLAGLTVTTEAASGAYVVTPVLAALAGAQRVFALARDSRYGSAAEVAGGVIALARSLDVADRIEVVTAKTREIVAGADIITNSGHLRPIDRAMVGWMKPTAVIPLMYEAWELREADIDVGACAARGIAVAATNERHAAVDVFSFLGRVTERLLAEGGLELRGRRIILLCDNVFRDFIAEQLMKSGATLDVEQSLEDGPKDACDAILVAMTPGPRPVIGSREANIIAHRYPGAMVAQFWGDLEREAPARCGLRFWPVEPPARGHQGIMLSRIGPEPVVRLQAGGLKVGEVMARARTADLGAKAGWARAIDAAVASGFGQALGS